jgi:hypothetical protein
MAATSSTIYAVTPLAGVDLGSKASAPAVAVLTTAWDNGGRENIYLKAVGSLGSTANVTVGTSGSAVSAASAGIANSFNVDTAGGVVVGQYFWARRNTV